MTRKWLLSIVAACLLAAPAANAVSIDVAANDVETGYNKVTGNLDSQWDGISAFVTSASDPALEIALVDFSITLSGPNTLIFGSQWVGGNSSGADLTIIDQVTSEPLLELEIHSITGGTSTAGAAGGSLTSITLGSLDASDPKSDLEIVGGALAASFGGVGANARLSLLISEVSLQINDPFGLGVLAQSFTGTTNLQLGVVATPEPSTAALLGSALLGLGMWRRARKTSARAR